MVDAPRLKRRSYLGPILGFVAFVILPTIAATYYYYFVHADRFVSEFRYSVRGGATMQSASESGLSAGGTSALVYAADSFVLEDYLISVQALEDIERRLPIREMMGKDGGDPIRRYDPDLPSEDLMAFWDRSVNVRYDALTGITTAEISLFTPEDAFQVSQALVDELQLIVNGLSKEARDEMLAYVNGQYELATNDLETARRRMETFRRENRIFSPEDTVSIETSIESDLSTTLSAKRVELRTLRERAANSPQIPILLGEIDALRRQLLDQIESREQGDGQTMASQIAAYQELEESYEFARQTYLDTFNLKQQAETNATLNQAQLVVFVQPRLPQTSIDPDRPLQIGIFFGVIFLVWLSIRIFLAGLKTQ